MRNPKTGELVVVQADVRGDQACTVHISADDGRSWAQGGELMVKPFVDCTIGVEYGGYAAPAFATDGTLYAAQSRSTLATSAPEVHALPCWPWTLARAPCTRLGTATTEPNNLAPGFEGDLEIFLRPSTDGGKTWGQRPVSTPRPPPIRG